MKNYINKLILLLSASILFFAACSNDTGGKEDVNLSLATSSENKELLSSSSSMTFSSLDVVSSSTEISSSMNEQLASSSSSVCSKDLEIEPTVFTSVNNINNSSREIVLSENGKVRAYYGDNVKFGTQQIIGEWYFSNDPSDVLSWRNIKLHSDSNVTQTHPLLPEVKEYNYGVSLDGRTLYLDYLDTNITESQEIRFLEEDSSGCLKIVWHEIEGTTNYNIQFLCEKSRIRLTCESNLEEDLNIENSGNFSFDMTLYNQTNPSLYYGENTYFGPKNIVGKWVLGSKVTLIFDEESYGYTIHGAGINMNSKAPYGVAKDGSKLYIQSIYLNKASTINEKTYLLYDYAELQFLNTDYNGCYNVKLSNWFNDVKNFESYELLCKEVD